MIGIKVHSSLPLRKGTRDCVVSTQSVCAAGTSEPVLILKVLMCTLLNINSQTPSDLRQGQSTCTIHCDFADSYLLYPCHGDSGGRAGCVTKPYKNYTVQILESELVLGSVHDQFSKAVSQCT